jgi:hypothetical protein
VPVTRRSRQWRLASVTVAAALLTGCSGARSHDPAADAAATPSGSPSTRATATASPSAPPDAPSPGDLATPATTAGPLSRSSFPRPATLGAGWNYSVDPGDAEEGYLGNGTPALARSPQEVVQAALPLGCPRRGSLPLPEHALEVDYTYRATKVIAVRMAFADRTSATAFYDRRTDGLVACRGRSGGAALGPLVTRVTPLSATVLLSDRTPASDPWTELAVADGSDVVLVAAHTRTDRPPLTGGQARALALSFQR